jgi:hypothetical protein
LNDAPAGAGQPVWDAQVARWATLPAQRRIALILLRAGLGLAFAVVTVVAMTGLLLLGVHLVGQAFPEGKAPGLAYLLIAPLPAFGVWLLYRLHRRVDALFGIQQKILDDVPPEALVSPPPPGQATICVFRSRTIGASVNVPVVLGSRLVGETNGERPLLFPVDPGPQTLTTVVKAYKMTLELEVKAGTTYFVWHELKRFSHRSRLYLVGTATASRD